MAGLTGQEKTGLIQAIDRVPQLQGVGIGFVGRDMSQVVRAASMPRGLQTWIVMQEDDAPAVGATPRPSKLKSELLQLGFDCGGALLAGVAVVGGAGAIPLSGGMSTAVSYLSWAAFIAGGLQCRISADRVISEIYDPSINDQLDSETWYQITSYTLDAISLAGGLAGLSHTARAAINLSKTSSRPLYQIVKGMNRAERKLLAQDLARYSGQAPTRKQFIRLARDGRIAKIFTRQQVSQAVAKEMLEAISNALSLTSSATSGILRQVTVYIVEEG